MRAYLSNACRGAGGDSTAVSEWESLFSASPGAPSAPPAPPPTAPPASTGATTWTGESACARVGLLLYERVDALPCVVAPALLDTLTGALAEHASNATHRPHGGSAPSSAHSAHSPLNACSPLSSHGAFTHLVRMCRAWRTRKQTRTDRDRARQEMCFAYEEDRILYLVRISLFHFIIHFMHNLFHQIYRSRCIYAHLSVCCV